jgi:hypothetical protein
MTFGPAGDKFIDERQWRAVEIGKQVRNILFDSDLPKLAEIKQLQITDAA